MYLCRRYSENRFMLRKILVLVFLLSCGLHYGTSHSVRGVTGKEEAGRDSVACMYHRMGLDGVVGWEAFQQAVSGYEHIEGKKKEVLTLIDFTQPSTAERLYLFDMKERKMMLTSLVAHGRNSGGNYATSFSNQAGSFKSSLGFYLTSTTYNGKNGYSLILDGLEKGVNDNARARAIVVHGAPYANPSVVEQSGRLGRSLGCPALPEKTSRMIIDHIKGGSVLFIYGRDG